MLWLAAGVPADQILMHDGRSPIGVSRGDGFDGPAMILGQLAGVGDPLVEGDATAHDFESVEGRRSIR